MLKIANESISIKAGLNNHIRNILAIMVDLIDIDLMNRNKGLGCFEQKEAAKKINQGIWEKFDEFSRFFKNIKEYRNSLCHLDVGLQRPYINHVQMIEFSKKLIRLEKIEYVNQFEKGFSKESKNESIKPDEQKIESKRDAGGLLPPSSGKIEAIKKAKEDTEISLEKNKEVSESLKSILEYGEDETLPTTGAPGMRGNNDYICASSFKKGFNC